MVEPDRPQMTALDNKRYRHRIFTTHCFAAATMVTRTRPGVALWYIACLVCITFIQNIFHADECLASNIQDVY
jgi:hypothetical protein